MIKGNSLAILISSLLIPVASHAALIYDNDGNKLSLYGKVRAEHYISKSADNDGDQSYVRFGFKGRTKINDWLQGYGQWEYEADSSVAESEGTDNDKTRLGFAGLKAKKWGSIDYGRNYGATYDIEAWTDVFPEFGGDGYVKKDQFMTKRANGLLTWRNNDFFDLIDGLDVALQYQGKNENDDRKEKTTNGDGYAASARYLIGGGVSVGAAYASSDRTLAQKEEDLGSGDRATTRTVGIQYDANQIYLAATFAQTRNTIPLTVPKGVSSLSKKKVTGYARKTQTMELAAQYQFDSGFAPSLGYVYTRAENIEGVGDADLVNYIDVAFTWYFNKNMSLFTDYEINRLSSDNKLQLDSDNILAVGMTYKF